MICERLAGTAIARESPCLKDCHAERLKGRPFGRPFHCLAMSGRTRFFKRDPQNGSCPNPPPAARDNETLDHLLSLVELGLEYACFLLRIKQHMCRSCVPSKSGRQRMGEQGRGFHLARPSMLIGPPPKAATCNSPPAIAIFFMNIIICIWSAKSLWNNSAVTTLNSASTSAATRV
jgi:hypothetical protein